MPEGAFAAGIYFVEASLLHPFTDLIHAWRVINFSNRLVTYIPQDMPVMPVIGAQRHISVFENVHDSKSVWAGTFEYFSSHAFAHALEQETFNGLPAFVIIQCASAVIDLIIGYIQAALCPIFFEQHEFMFIPLLGDITQKDIDARQ